MEMKHEEFILSSIEQILEDAANATKLLNIRIEAFPLNDYILKSVFLEMTGFQEQKFKCIAWDIATENFEFRFDYLHNYADNYFSSYKEKKIFYIKLKNILGKSARLSKAEKKLILKDAKDKIESIIEKSNLKDWNRRDYEVFVDNIEAEISEKEIALDNHLLNDGTREIYEKLYRNRNRLAHNTPSYQQNLPKFQILEDEKFGYNNYFVWFYILIVIDRIMINLYKKIIENLRNS